MDVAVLGGGAFGCSAALALAERGHDVIVHEPRGLGAGATHKAAGVCSTFTWNRAELDLIAATRGEVGALISLALVEGADDARAAWRPVDSVLVARADDARLDAVRHVVESAGEEPEHLDGRAAQQVFPSLDIAPDEAALVAQEDGVLDAGALMSALRTRLEGEGVSVVARQGDVASLRAESEAVVVAAGAWTPGLLGAVGVALPLRSFRTQAAVLEMPGDVPIVHDLRHGFYARPESETTVIAGDGTRLRDHDPDDYDERPDTKFRDHIAQAMTKRFRDGGAARWRTGWAGLCVATPDRHPLCGAVPGEDRLFVLTGDNGFGLMRCLELGDRLARAVDGEGTPWLDPGRFGADFDPAFPMREGFGDLAT